MRRSAFTLLELLVAAIIAVMVIAGSGLAYESAITTQARHAARVEQQNRITKLEDRLTTLLQSAVLPIENENPAGYFILNALSGSTTQSGQRLVFSAFGDRVRWDALRSDEDFETQNQRYGTLGGLAEVELGTETIGEGTPQEGLLVRSQRPADGDPTQGGEQEVLSADVTSLEFEFYDGANWITEWDTQTQTTKRLPAAVRVTYLLDGEDQNRILVVRLPESDVTLENPLTTDGGDE